MKANRSNIGRLVFFEMPEAEFRDLDDSYRGICVACDSVRDGCEPDARRCRCDACGQPAVFGTSELLMMGRIRFTGESDESEAP